MVKFDNVKIHNLDNAINGIVEFETSDSKIGMYLTDYADEVIDEMKFKYGEATPDAWVEKNDNIANVVALGPTDMKKLQLETLRGNKEFLKYITVTCDVTAPLSWWVEFDRHNLGMSIPAKSLDAQLAEKPFCIDSFDIENYVNVEYPIDKQREDLKSNIDSDFVQMCYIPYLNFLREDWLVEKNKDAFNELKRWLPVSYLQTRKIVTNYAELSIVCNSAFTSWSRTLVPFIYSLPYLKDFMN